MSKKYILGVDGGGTKTDFLLFDIGGNFVDHIREGTCSHEGLPGGFPEAEQKLGEYIGGLLARNNIGIENIAAAAFGLAGIDVPYQLERIDNIIRNIGFSKFAVNNDSFLGIKAGCRSGIGICSINGTGTVASGINEYGKMLQVGGIGSAVGDSAGGGIIAGYAVRAVYDNAFRCGPETVLTGKLMELFEIHNKSELLDAVSQKYCSTSENHKAITTLLFEGANDGDKVACEIVRHVADELARSVSGCMLNLGFKAAPEIVLAGSIWVKGNCPLMLSHFIERVFSYTGKRINPSMLNVIPAAGAVTWALELAQGYPASEEQRIKVTSNVNLNF